MNLRRAAANAAILNGLSLLLMFITWMLLIPAAGLTMDDSTQPTKVGEFAMTHRGLWTAACISDVICAVTIPLLCLGLYRKFQRSQPGRATLIGVFGVMAGTLFCAAGAIAVLAPNFVARLANPAETIGALGAVQQPIEIAGVFFISIATWNVARAAQAARTFNSVIIYSGYIASLGVLALPLNMISVEAGMVGLFPGLVSIIYNLALGANLMNASKNQELEPALA